MALEEELETYRSKLAELLQGHAGEYVLIYKDQVRGIYPTLGEALEQGYEQIGLDPFMVRQIEEHEKVIFVKDRWLFSRIIR